MQQELAGKAIVKLEVNEHWLNVAQKCPSPNFNQRPNNEISLLVVHNISLPPKQYGGPYVEDFFCNRLDASVHPYFCEISQLEVSSHLLSLIHI